MEEDSRKFILVTDTFAGLGLAKQHKDRYPDSEVIIGYCLPDCKMSKEEEKEQWELYDKDGEGIVETFRLDKLIKNREQYRDWNWVWDGNFAVEENELLRKESFKVTFGGEFPWMLENNREFATEFAKECDFDIPDTFEFKGHDLASGIKLLEQHEEEAFVFKPNHSQENWLTYVPINEDSVNANLELCEFLSGIDKAGLITEGYILQRRIKGVEVNVEGFMMNGKWIYAHANFENKKLAMNDTGAASGCAFDIEFTIPLDCKLFKITVGKYEEKLRAMNFTGFADANVIIGEYQEVNFLENCMRPGFNSHPNLFYNLMSHTFLQCAADLQSGTFVPKVKDGFGASLTIFTEHYNQGLPVYVPESLNNKFYLFDGYIEDDKLKMAGLDHEIGIAMAHEYSIEVALKNVVENAEKIIIPNRYARWDAFLNKDVPSGPKRRWEALNSLHMFDSLPNYKII